MEQLILKMDDFTSSGRGVTHLYASPRYRQTYKPPTSHPVEWSGAVCTIAVCTDGQEKFTQAAAIVVKAVFESPLQGQICA